MKKLVVLVASMGKNVELGNKVIEVAKSKNFETSLVNLVELGLPLYSTLEEENGIPEKAINLANQLADSDGIAVIAPEYNGSIPPVLNNSIAWISRSSKDWRNSFNAKPTFIGTHSGGGGAYVLMAMRQQLSYLGANVIGRQLLTNFGKELNIESLESCLDQLV
ncbi:MAG: NADPH-dependent FMN reductase [Bacteriovoracaceae bacterium]